MFCALHDQLDSLGRHAQLTRCFSAVAELLVDDELILRCTVYNNEFACISKTCLVSDCCC